MEIELLFLRLTAEGDFHIFINPLINGLFPDPITIVTNMNTYVVCTLHHCSVSTRSKALWPSITIRPYGIRTLTQDWFRLSAKPLPKLMLTYRQLDPRNII